MGRSLVQPMTAVAFLLGALAVSYAVTALMIWHSYRRNYTDRQVSSPDSLSDDA